METLLCDFCSTPEPAWAYPAADFQDSPISVSVGGWCACQMCHDLIESGCREGLVTRSFQKYLSKHGPALDSGGLMVALGEIQKDFFAHRTGPAIRMEG